MAGIKAIGLKIGANAADRWVVALALLSIPLIAIFDRYLATLSLRGLYVIPVLAAAAVVPRNALLVLAAGVMLLSEAVEPDAWSEGAIIRGGLGFAVLAVSGLLVGEVVRNRRNLHQLEEQQRRREQAEEESRQLVESSPGAIVLVGPEGRIERANHAAHELLGFDDQSLIGEKAIEWLPVLGPFLDSPRNASLVRTMVEGGGRRKNGEGFFAQLWLSTYRTRFGQRLAVIFSDATEVLRDREEVGLRQLLMSSRIVAAAVSHEVKNLSAAAYLLHSQLAKQSGISASEEYQALGKLLDNMRKLASEELGPSIQELRVGADLNAVLQEFCMILEPGFRESGIRFKYDVQADLPRVRADHGGLLQVFLNLAQNFERALQDLPEKKVTLLAYRMDRFVIVRFANNGPAIADPERLFHPLQPKSTATGLGMFISRAILRTYGGELQHVPQPQGCLFLVQLPIASAMEDAANA